MKHGAAYPLPAGGGRGRAGYARALLLLLLLIAIAGCRSASTSETPTPAPVETAVAVSSTAGALEAIGFLTGQPMQAGTPSAPSPCPPADVSEWSHCVWFKPAPGVTAADLVKRMKQSGFDAEAEAGKVTAWWTEAQLTKFFGVKPGYVRTGASAGDATVCLAIVPKGGKPPAALKSAIAGYAVDDPVCEM